jgi:HlyD family secretion protein
MNLGRLVRDRKVLAAAGLVTVLLAVGLWPRSAAVDVAPVERGLLRVTVDDEGETRVRDRFVISASVAGRVLLIELEPGDPVRPGDVVATLRPAPPALLDQRSRAEALAGVETAKAAVGRALATRDKAKSDLERHRMLAAQGVVSPEVLELRETDARAAAYAAATAEGELERARAVLLQATAGSAGRTLALHSPADGVVLKRLRESEAVLPPGEPLLELGNPAELEIVSDLLSVDAVKVRPGQAVLIEQWGGDQALRGRVRRIEPSGFMKVSALGVEEQRVNVVIDFADPAEKRGSLGDGYRVEVKVVVWEGSDVVKAPTSSLFRQGDDWAAFVVDGGRSRLRRVAVGRRNGLEAEILKGLSAGERVVVHPADTLKDGSRVVPRSL